MAGTGAGASPRSWRRRSSARLEAFWQKPIFFFKKKNQWFRATGPPEVLAGVAFSSGPTGHASGQLDSGHSWWPGAPVVDPLERDLQVAFVSGCCAFSGPHGLAPQACLGRGTPKGPQAMLADAQCGDQRGELDPLAPLCLEEVPGPVDSRLALPGPTLRRRRLYEFQYGFHKQKLGFLSILGEGPRGARQGLLGGGY